MPSEDNAIRLAILSSHMMFSTFLQAITPCEIEENGDRSQPNLDRCHRNGKDDEEDDPEEVQRFFVGGIPSGKSDLVEDVVET
jgi:hypothetical protein